MTNAEIKAISEVLSYISRMVMDIRADTKAMRAEQTISRGSMAQELRRLRDRVAKLTADRESYRKIRAELANFTDRDEEPHAHTKAIHKEFAIKKNNPK